MAGKGGATPATYSPSPTTRRDKKEPSVLTDGDWVRPDGRGFQQCRPAYQVLPFCEALSRLYFYNFNKLVDLSLRQLNDLKGALPISMNEITAPCGLSLLDALVLRTAAVNSASGSAYAEFGNTKVIVSVFGPRESKKAMMYSDVGRLNCNISYTTFATPIRGQGGDKKELSAMLHKALKGAIILESFPKTTVDVFALVLESGGGLNRLMKSLAGDFPVVVSCASLALADAGILLYDLVAAVSVSRLGERFLLDPVSEEESNQDGSLMITCMPSRNEVTQLTVTGEWSTSKVHEAMQLCLDACSKLGKVMRSCLKEAVSDSGE